MEGRGTVGNGLDDNPSTETGQLIKGAGVRKRLHASSQIKPKHSRCEPRALIPVADCGAMVRERSFILRAIVRSPRFGELFQFRSALSRATEQLLEESRLIGIE